MTHLIAQEHSLTTITDNIIVFCDKDKNLLYKANELDLEYENIISNYLNYADYRAKEGEIAKVNVISDEGVKNIYVVSLGDIEKLDNAKVYKLGLNIAKELKAEKVEIVTLLDEDVVNQHIEKLLEAFVWIAYDFTEFKTKNIKNSILELIVQTSPKKIEDLNNIIENVFKLNDGVKLARNLVNNPANVVTPDYLSKEAEGLKKLGVKVSILDEKQLTKKGLNLLLAVGQGSQNRPNLTIMRYMGAGDAAPVHGLVGKGISFDTGGYSLKGAANMPNMKSDMGGAAAVIGTMKVLAAIKAPVNVVAAIACAENMVSSNAYRPDDVIKAYNGLTVEIKNTDAEGRLVMADALSYVVDKYKVDEIVDIATLTGACMVSLGAEYAGLMSKNDGMAEQLFEAGQQSQDKVWRLPMGDAYAESLKSNIADTSNVGSTFGGHISAAEFLNKFVSDTPHAHVDIAGVALLGKIPGSLNNMGVKGASGFGVKLLTQYYLNKK